MKENAVNEPLDQLDMPLLLALDALVREGNITRAARSLGITQPAMSARLTRLRQIFDDKLFVPANIGRGVVATPRTLALAPSLEDALDTLRRLVRSGRPFEPRTSSRTFVIAMHDNPAMMVGAGLIARALSSAPAASFALVIPNGETISAELERGRVDLLIGSPETVDPSMIVRGFLGSRFVTAQRKGHPRGSGAIDLDRFCELDHLLVSTDGGGFTGLVDQSLAALGRQRHVAASIQSYALAPFVVEATDLVCTLPARLLSRFTETLDLFDPPLELSPFALSMIWHPRNQEDEGHIWLRGLIAAAVENLKA
jgi:DNA-binding transcriptional LysR family regulator